MKSRNTKKHIRSKQSSKQHEKLLKQRVNKWYGAGAVVTLLISTSLWSWWGARLQLQNADQLVSPYLFESWGTFHGAQFPAAHTFLIKWPLFLLVRILGYQAANFTAITMLVSVGSVALFAYLLYRIDKRPLVWGSLYMVLASMLMLVPPQAYAGALLPVNMAMLTTRNLEYVWFLACIALISRASHIKRWQTLVAIISLGLLVASDKLFLSIIVGGAVFALGATFATRKKYRLVIVRKWLLISVMAFGVSSVILWLISSLHITHFTTIKDNSPYGLVTRPTEIIKGVLFMATGVLTNFGANPLFDITTKSTVIAVLRERLVTPVAVPFLINAFLFAVGLVMSVRLFFRALHARKASRALLFSFYVSCSGLSTIGVFIITKHYYLVDARYLALVPFAVFVAAAVFMRKETLRVRPVLAFGGVLLCSVILGAIFAGQTFHKGTVAMSRDADRNRTINEVLLTHRVGTLVGDYWRVLPIKHAASGGVSVTPLEGCLKNRKTLSSEAWQPSLKKRSFAYLISFDKSQTDFPQCSFDEVTAAYGRPNASVLVSGRVEKPEEMLLFYDRGVEKNISQNAGTISQQSASTILPATADLLTGTKCANGNPTIMNIVAHEDDDLLFQSPDLLQDLSKDSCVRTVYVTAGDAGANKLYWLDRERGSQAAYSNMLNDTGNIWIDRVVKLGDGQFATVTNPRGNRKVSLTFLRLPDGNMHGQGFRGSNHESLNRLENGYIQNIHSVDGQSTYNHDSLIKTLTRLMDIYQPTEVRTLAPHDENDTYPDHSDHKAVGSFVAAARTRYNVGHSVTLRYYLGYPAHAHGPNINGQNLQNKMAAFMAYSRFDPNVCKTTVSCLNDPTYGSYLQRQYQLTQ